MDRWRIKWFLSRLACKAVWISYLENNQGVMSYSSFKLLDSSRPILIFGRDGQVGRALQVCLKDLQVPAIFLGRHECDLSDVLKLTAILNQYQPQVIINAAAYTAVDQAESQPDLAFAINAKAPQVMAQYIEGVSRGILVHYSTDYVFADTKQTPYLETDSVGPVDQLCVYGQSKLAGEKAIEEVFKLIHESGDVTKTDHFSRYFILRTSWVYGDGSNFIRTMLKLAGERDSLKVVADQVGVPSSATWLAQIGVQLAGSKVASGVYNAVPDGEVSWHGLAMFAIEAGAAYGGGLELKSECIQAIPAKDYPLPAIRPYNSRMSNMKLKKVLSEMAFTGQYPHWREQVDCYVEKIVKESLKS
jgi:dTDP-4-dehydrorhamnose reductase